MKKMIALLLAFSMLLCGCGNKAAEEPSQAPTTVVTEPITEPTTEPTTVPTTEPPVYTNPLNGEIIEAPFTNRVFASTISNIREALPHVSVNEADVLMEMFVNTGIIRCIALFSDVSEVEAFGSVRSTRYMFNDIAEHYNTILCHAAGMVRVLEDMEERGVDNINLDSWVNIQEGGVSYRDKEYHRGLEHSLFGIGPAVVAFAENHDIATKVEEGADYGFVFAEDGTPADGEIADEVKIRIQYMKNKKETIMKYDQELGKYVYWQYGKMMADQITKEPEAFENVVVMNASLEMKGIYMTADFNAGGDGYFACGGKIIPITWTCSGDDQPFRFFTADGTPVSFGVGNTYIAISTTDGEVTWTAAAE